MSLTRRDTLAAAAGLALAPVATRAATARPNILYILADDMGYADLACYGHPTIRTPNLDRLAAEGARCLQAYASSAVCSATRLALITGRYQYRLPLGLEEPLTTADVGLDPGHPTLPSLLRKAGYKTTLIGKWHLGALPKYGPLKSGYDGFYGFRGGALDYLRHETGTQAGDLWDGDVRIEETGYLTDLLGQRAVETVRAAARDSAPFFVSLHFNAPHWPWEGPDDGPESGYLAGKSLFHWEGGNLRIYTEMVERMDHQIGRVLAALEATGQAGNTIVLFTSDNGGERFSNTWPFSGRKTELLEGGLRVPAIVRWPGRVRAGTVFDQVNITMDWTATLLAAAGAAHAPAYPLDGIDLTSALAGAAPVQRTLYWRYKSNHQRAIRQGDYKLLKIRDETYLFDVAQDPLERANLKARRPEVFDRLAAAWDAWNHGMLPEIAESYGDAFSANLMADHIGAGRARLTVDDMGAWPGRPSTAPH